MEIKRQHDATSISELDGGIYTKLQGVGPGNETGFHAWFLEANHTWYRFFIQHGILFWDTVEPDPEDDLADDEDYYDVIQQFAIPEGGRIESVEMREGYLTIAIAAGPKLVIKELEETGGMSITVT